MPVFRGAETHDQTAPAKALTSAAAVADSMMDQLDYEGVRIDYDEIVTI